MNKKPARKARKTPYPTEPLKRRKLKTPLPQDELARLYDYIERRQLDQRAFIERHLKLFRDEFEAFKVGNR